MKDIVESAGPSKVRISRITPTRSSDGLGEHGISQVGKRCEFGVRHASQG